MANIPYIGEQSPEVRELVLKAIANAKGIRLPDTWFPMGDHLLPVGEEKKAKLEAEMDELPDLLPGLLALGEAIALTKPADVKTKVWGIRATGDAGALVDSTDPQARTFGYSHAGLAHFLGFIKPKSVSGTYVPTIAAISPAIRAQVINDFAERALVDSAKGDVVLRTAVAPVEGGGSRRYLRAVVSKVHSQEFGDDIALVKAIPIVPGLPEGGKIRVTREEATTTVEIFFPMLKREIRVGDVLHAYVKIVNSEIRAGSIEVHYGVLRGICKNLTTAAGERVQEIRIRHVGDVGPKIAEGLKNAIAEITPFVEAFGDAYKIPLPAFAGTRGELLSRMGTALELPERILARASELWDADGPTLSAGDTLAGAVNALTRASQEETMEVASIVNGVAGRLVLDGWSALK